VIGAGLKNVIKCIDLRHFGITLFPA